jgi:hypothetical protein
MLNSRNIESMENTMRVSTKFALPLSVALFTLLLLPQAVRAGTADCPVEPASNVRIGDGEVLTGTNCTLNTAGDVDSFVFNGTSGDTYQLAVAINLPAPVNICLTLYSPSLTKIYTGCTAIGTFYNQNSVVTNQTLAATGRYTMDITEPVTGTVNYAVSLERLYPFPPNEQEIPLGKSVAGDIAELTDSNAFTFGVVTTGIYEVSATLPSNASQNLCMTVYQPNGATAGSGCTAIGTFYNQYSVQVQFTPSEAGTSMAFLSVEGNDGTASYSLEVSCAAGQCGEPSVCSLKDTLSYASGTLTMDFSVENTYATTWNIWLTDQNTITLVYSASQPITTSPTAITKTASLSPEGKVGVLSTLTTPTKGIACSSWVQVETGTP